MKLGWWWHTPFKAEVGGPVYTERPISENQNEKAAHRDEGGWKQACEPHE